MVAVCVSEREGRREGALNSCSRLEDPERAPISPGRGEHERKPTKKQRDAPPLPLIGLCATKCGHLLCVTARPVPGAHKHSTLLSRRQGQGGAGARGSHYALGLRESARARVHVVVSYCG